MNISPTLCSLIPGQSAIVAGIAAHGQDRRRLRELGFTDGTRTELVLHRNGIDAFLVKGTVIALRSCDSSCVVVEPDMPVFSSGRGCSSWR